MLWALVVIRSGLEDAASCRLHCEHENVLGQDRLVFSQTDVNSLCKTRQLHFVSG